MATKPQWRRPWEEHPASEAQSSSASLVAFTSKSNQPIKAPSHTAVSPFDTTGTGAAAFDSRKLPPLPASLDASAEAAQAPLSSSRRPSLNSNNVHGITSPNITWQYESSASNKRKRGRGAEPENYSSTAYSSHLTRDAPASQVQSGQR